MALQKVCVETQTGWDPPPAQMEMEQKPLPIKEEVQVKREKKRHHCLECGKSFAVKFHLRRHLMTHSGEKPFQCNKCGQAFSQKAHLKSHLDLHEGNKDFSCMECGKLFSRKANLQKHLKVHVDKKPFTFLSGGEEKPVLPWPSHARDSSYIDQLCYFSSLHCFLINTLFIAAIFQCG